MIRLRWGRVVVAALALIGALVAPGVSSAWVLHTLDGREIAPGSLAPRWALLYLGYTHCADICPAALLDLGEVLERLGPEAQRVQPVFVSIDPERDEPGLLRRYLESFAAPLIALTGSEAEIGVLARELGYHYVRYIDPSLAGYTFDHTSSFFLLDPGGARIADFATELSPEEIAASIHDIIARTGEPR